MTTPTATLASMIISPAAAYRGRLPMVIVMSSDPEPVMIGMMIIAVELVAGGFSGSCGGEAMTRGPLPGSGTGCRAGRCTGVVVTEKPFRYWGNQGRTVATVMIPCGTHKA
ncbi:hypothetical protein GCM10022630_37180 [Thermobifida alba]